MCNLWYLDLVELWKQNLGRYGCGDETDEKADTRIDNDNRELTDTLTERARC